MPCTQYAALQREFPKTLSQLEKSFLPLLAQSVTDSSGKNPAGYVLYQLRRAADHARQLHGELQGSLPCCDRQFAEELCWHVEKKTVFRNVIPALGACWYNRVHERGERWRLDACPPRTINEPVSLRVVNTFAQVEEALINARSRKGQAAG